jgi:hypothetical protein
MKKYIISFFICGLMYADEPQTAPAWDEAKFGAAMEYSIETQNTYAVNKYAIKLETSDLPLVKKIKALENYNRFSSAALDTIRDSKNGMDSVDLWGGITLAGVLSPLAYIAVTEASKEKFERYDLPRSFWIAATGFCGVGVLWGLKMLNDGITQSNKIENLMKAAKVRDILQSKLMELQETKEKGN